jgi:hypothetical protein
MGATIGFAVGITLTVSELFAAVNNIAIVADDLQHFQRTWPNGTHPQPMTLRCEVRSR